MEDLISFFLTTMWAYTPAGVEHTLESIKNKKFVSIFSAPNPVAL